MEKHKALYDFLIENGEKIYGITGNWEKDKQKFCEMQDELDNIIVETDE